MPRFSVLLLTAAFAAAESHPSWWSLASPEATALVGIQWENVRHSPFAEPVGAELAASGSLGFPDLPCLTEAKQILISSPALLAIVNGTFPAAVLREQAASKGLKASTYRGVSLWISPGKSTLSIAQLSDQILLVGLLKTLEGTIDRSLAETDSPEGGRQYSPLLARAARFARTKDLWVVAARLPDPLAKLFVPVEAEAHDFQGAISVREGLELEATLDADSEQGAAEIGETLRGSVAALPGIVRGLQVTVTGQSVSIGLQVSRDQLTASLRKQEPVTPVAPEPPKQIGPQVIRIFGLDEGPREVVLAPPSQ